LIFDKVTEKNMLAPFLWPTVYKRKIVIKILSSLQTYLQTKITPLMMSLEEYLGKQQILLQSIP